VGQVVHTLPEGPPVWGITSLAGEIYLLRWKERDQVEVYDVISYRLQRRLTVPDAKGFNDMTSCEHYHCVYIADDIIACIHRLDEQGAATRWPVNDKPWGLSVNAAHSLLVACLDVRKIKEFSSHGDLLRKLTLPDDVISPFHTIQLTTGQLVVCHGYDDDALNRVCMISADGRHIVHSHGGQPGSDTGQYCLPVHLAVDNNEFVFVADVGNRRVTLLSPTLQYVRQVVSSDKLKWHPHRLYLDVQRRRLYVAERELKYDEDEDEDEDGYECEEVERGLEEEQGQEEVEEEEYDEESSSSSSCGLSYDGRCRSNTCNVTSGRVVVFSV